MPRPRGRGRSFVFAGDADMRILIFSKALAVLTIPAMVGVFLSPNKGLTSMLASFLQYEALALAGAIVAAMAVPNMFGVRKGERVLLITNDPVSNAIVVRLVVALESGRLHENIKIAMDGGLEALATVESYPGILTPARVSVKTENAIRVI